MYAIDAMIYEPYDLWTFKTLNLSDTAILKIENAGYWCIISRIRKSEAINLMQNINLTEKVEHYKKLNVKSNFEAVNLLQILI